MERNSARGKTRVARTAAALVLAVALLAALASGVARAGVVEWNDAQIAWLSYDEGLKAAKKSGTPIFLVVYTTWCPHCGNYASLFSNPQIVEKSKSFVMIRLDGDKDKALSSQYQPDGNYYPRTFFLSPDGKLDDSLKTERVQYKYFYKERDPSDILGGMDRALTKLTPGP